MSRLVSEVWLQHWQLSSHAFRVITFLTRFVRLFKSAVDVIVASKHLRFNTSSNEEIFGIKCPVSRFNYQIKEMCNKLVLNFKYQKTL